MSSSANARSTAYNERRTAATSGAKPRVTTARAGAKERPDSSGDVLPEDSASNAPKRKSDSGVSEMHSWRRHTESETQRTRSQVLKRESIRVTKAGSVDGPAENSNGSRIKPTPVQRAESATSRMDDSASAHPRKQEGPGRPTMLLEYHS